MTAGGTIGILADMLQLRRKGEEEAYDDYKQEFEAINRTLHKLGLPEHHEPEDIAVWTFDLGPVRGLHALRRVAAHLDRFGKLPPLRGEAAGRDPLVQDYYGHAEHRPRKFDHLVMHSDCEGYYLPVDFPRVIYSRRGLEVPYHMIGSSYRLLAECREIARALALPARLSPRTIREWWRPAEGTEPSKRWQVYCVEAYVCATLIQAAKQSIDWRAAIWFS
jgi:hypothetical protein